MLCTWFPWTPRGLTLAEVKTRREKKALSKLLTDPGRGLPYATSAFEGEGGSQKADKRNKVALINSVVSRGEGVKKSKFMRMSYMEDLILYPVIS